MLDSDTAMAAQQERFYPYLVGYVALYTHDPKSARTELTRAIGMKGGENDAFLHYLLALADEQLGQHAEASALYRKAFGLATAHNPPSALVRRMLRGKVHEAAGAR